MLTLSYYARPQEEKIQMNTRIPLLRLAPEIWKYQTLTKLFLIPLLAASRMIFPAFLADGYRAFFDGWLRTLFFSLLLLLFALYAFVDLNVKILYAGNMMDGEKEPVFSTLKKAVAAVPKCGFFAFFYMALLSALTAAAPILFHTPNLPPSAYLAYAAVALAFAVRGLTRIFGLHGVLLDGLTVREARRGAKALMKFRWRDFLSLNAAYGLSALSFLTLAGVLLFISPLSLGALFLPGRYTATTARSLMILALMLNAALVGALSLLATPCYVLRMTRLYRNFTKKASGAIPKRPGESHPALAALAFFYILEIAALSSQTAYRLDDYFPPLTQTRIIAHRGGGNRNAENTLSGLETAIALGAYGSEIDIQRTLDGHYIVNHDPTFRRLAGESRAPEEMTLEEVKALRYPVPTLEEMLDAARGRIRLFIELKGATADLQMCDDTVNMILERSMAEQTVVISFEHDLISYIEDNWPEIRTGCLTSLARRNPASYHCDYLGLEEVAATESMIRGAHAQGKKAFVWTPNDPDALERFLTADADAVITDNVAQALKTLDSLNRENDLGRILDAFR